MTFKTAVTSMRLRTLPLSLAGIMMGIFLSIEVRPIDWWTCVLLIMTAVSLQILSNLSNELGDAQHGTDNAEDRQGMHYSLMDGKMTRQEMKRLISLFESNSMVFGLIMIEHSFNFPDFGFFFFLFFGAAAIWAAKHYTMGKNPYGYRGLGDIAVFVFFGLATVVGGCIICAHALPSWYALMPAATIGLFSVGVLNVNNIRDAKTDAATRVTVAIKLGERGSRIYQTILITAGWLLMVAYTLLTDGTWLYLFTLPFFILHLHGVWLRKDRGLDKMLPLLVVSSFLFSVLFGIGIIIHF